MRTAAALMMVLLAALPCGAEESAHVGAREGAQAGAEASSPGLYLVSSLDSREELLAYDGENGGRPEGKSEALRDNPAVMLLASLAVPGSGQLIQGEARGYVYMLVEAALWGGFFVLDQKGLDERDDYERFADENWNADEYYAWYDAHCTSPCEDCPECRPLADYGTQEYYEDIGKYAAYWGWWKLDGHEGYPDYSETDRAIRDEYYDMRGESNLHLRQARYAMMAVLLNHVVSAFDSLLTARNDEGPVAGSGRDTGLEFGLNDEGTGITCTLVSRY
ncbi:MAG: hypothetical protein JXB46_01610 [Candidatus Eisenbacteria bacterium]|nr:hypothetical protein [Candidatus Eisenbacteria bacterium]